MTLPYHLSIALAGLVDAALWVQIVRVVRWVAL